MAVFNQQGQVMLKFPTVMASANSHSERSGQATIWDMAAQRPSLPSLAEFQLLMGLWPDAIEAPGVSADAVCHAAGNMIDATTLTWLVSQQHDWIDEGAKGHARGLQGSQELAPSRHLGVQCAHE
ncbi:hypothetical protein WJX74_005367 [Apatococcus lobatus]|uniref:Uncharacterized protein n=1 Tax=Apatococcus lobatus TaxID=904363 RepID=A0AAW1QMI0_9CHLO